MDSYQRKTNDQEGQQGQQKPPTKPLKPGTGQLSMDSFTAGGTAPLNRGAAGTRRLGTGSIEVEKTIHAMRTEIDNGHAILSKLEVRINVLKRALAVADRPAEAAKILTGVSAGEAGFTKQVAQMLQQDPGTKRRVQVATYQFDQAHKGLLEADTTLSRANGLDGSARANFVDSNCHVEKLRGQLYPLINLHVVFKDNQLLSQLIPTPKVASAAEAEAEPEVAPQPSGTAQLLA
ncbi:MAG TPA: hypothetical protein V6D47_21205, partial [Oscillatoriaceae cyanobacterium]